MKAVTFLLSAVTVTVVVPPKEPLAEQPWSEEPWSQEICATCITKKGRYIVTEGENVIMNVSVQTRPDLCLGMDDCHEFVIVPESTGNLEQLNADQLESSRQPDEAPTVGDPASADVCEEDVDMPNETLSKSITALGQRELAKDPKAFAKTSLQVVLASSLVTPASSLFRLIADLGLTRWNI